MTERVRCQSMRAWVVSAGILLASSAWPAADPGEVPAPEQTGGVFSEVWTLVRDRFVDPELRGLDWEEVRRRYSVRAARAATVSERAAVINEMLAELRTSHTHYYTRLDPEYYQLLGIFQDSMVEELARWFPESHVWYPTLGLLTESIEGQTFVRGALEGFPAHMAGILVGDRVVSADGVPFQPVLSLEAGRAVQLQIQRTTDAENVSAITVKPMQFDRGEFYSGVANSARTLNRNGHEIGYVHVWSWAGEEYQRLLERLLASAPIGEAEGLVLDLREGWGGADPDYLHMFHCGVPRIMSIDREGSRREGFRCWDKPVVLLINEKTRSGKELVAYGFRKYGMGQLVGTRTAGAVTAGKGFLLSDGSLLYLAVAEVLADGERLEGVGVAPDIEVPFDIRYAAGTDPQLDRAVDVILEELTRKP